jgi:hypothetical protein
MDNKYDLSDLVVSALEQKPLDFEVAFNELIVDRIRDAVENEKIKIAQQMYGYEPEAEEENNDAETEEDSNIEDTEDAEEFE